MEVQESDREVPAHCWNKIAETGQIEEGERNSLSLPASPLPLGGPVQCQESPSQPVISPMKENENVSECPASAAVWDATKGPLLSHSIWSTES